jgi:glutamine synthetase type III
MLSRTLLRTASAAARAPRARAASSINVNRFDDHALRAAVDDDTYAAFHAALESGAPMEKKHGNAVATAMMDWATQRGAQTFAHWFS